MTSYRKVKDCCHYTGNQRGAAHNISNLHMKKTYYDLHYVSNYD